MTTARAREDADAEFRSLPITALVESPTNPRRTFHDIDVLADSIKSHGVLQPLVVRPSNGHFEIVAGARRHRAAQVAGLQQVPVRVMALDDASAQEAQIVENLQRADVPPMEEAHGFQALIDRDRANTPEVIARRVGRSLACVYQRMKLLTLLPEVQEALAADVITVAHALLLTRVPPAQQAKAFEQCFHALYEGQTRENLAPLRQLKQWVDTKTQLDVRGTDAQVLLPEVARAVEHHEAETGASVLALSTLHYHTSESEPRPVLARSWIRADGKASCKHAQLGVIVVGDSVGSMLKVCVAKKACAKHWPQADPKRHEAAQQQRAEQAQAREGAEREAEARRLERERFEDRKKQALARAAAELSKAKFSADRARAILSRLHPLDELRKMLDDDLKSLTLERFYRVLLVAVVIRPLQMAWDERQLKAALGAVGLRDSRRK